jgi:arabinogalactan endo-1,4-beta-galactosidase
VDDAKTTEETRPTNFCWRHRYPRRAREVTLVRQGRAYGQTSCGAKLLNGGDISMLPEFESLGSVYRDEGIPADAIEIMMRHGCNCFRLRLFVAPTGRNAVIQDLSYVVKLAQRIKKAGASLLLDIHYSDTWADPGHQSKPDEWKQLSFPALEARVESYTASVIETMKTANCLPDIVQVGNEITPGFIWPDGQLQGEDGNWQSFTQLLKAGIRGVEKSITPKDRVKIMIHIDKGGSESITSWFFANLQKHNVEYDMIGLSYYPWWHGSMDALRANLKSTANKFRKPIVVVETAYPHSEGKGQDAKDMEYPKTPEGQKKFLNDIMEAVQSTPDGLGRGVLWWYPESIPNKRLNVWMGGRMALFDAEGNALPALEVFQTSPHANKELKAAQ